MQILAGEGDFSLPPGCRDWLWGPPSLLLSGNWGSRLLHWGVKWLGHGVYHSPPCSAEVKNE